MELVKARRPRLARQCRLLYVYFSAHFYRICGQHILALQVYEEFANNSALMANIPGGAVARATLFANMAHECLALGRTKKCVGFLTKSLEEDEDYEIHYLRAQMRIREVMLNTEKRKAAYEDLKLYFTNPEGSANVDDKSYYNACFSMAALCSHRDGLTGNIKEGRRWYQKGMEAYKRHRYLFGSDADELQDASPDDAQGMVHNNYAPPGVPAAVVRAQHDEVYRMQMACQEDEGLARAFRAALPAGGERASAFRNLCANCSKTTRDKDAAGNFLTLKKCQRCGQVVYCCRACQVAHWKAGHKRECKAFVAQREEMAAGGGGGD